MKNYKEFINEELSVRDAMKPKSNEEIKKKLKTLSDSDKIKIIIENKIDYKFLSDNLVVEGDLDCSNNQLTKLPDNLTVGGYLECSHNKVKLELPSTATLFGCFYDD